MCSHTLAVHILNSVSARLRSTVIAVATDTLWQGLDGVIGSMCCFCKFIS